MSFGPSLFYKKKNLIKKRVFESSSRYEVFDGWNNDKPVNARVIALIVIALIAFRFEIKCYHQCF